MIAHSDSDDDSDDGIEFEHRGVSVSKRVIPDEDVSYVRFTLRTDRDAPRAVRLRDPLPESIPLGEVGFHPDHEDDWAVEDGELVYEQTVPADEPLDTVYAVRATDPETASAFRRQPVVEVPADGDDPAGPTADAADGASDTAIAAALAAIDEAATEESSEEEAEVTDEAAEAEEMERDEEVEREDEQPANGDQSPAGDANPSDAPDGEPDDPAEQEDDAAEQDDGAGESDIPATESEGDATDSEDDATESDAPDLETPSAERALGHTDGGVPAEEAGDGGGFEAPSVESPGERDAPRQESTVAALTAELRAGDVADEEVAALREALGVDASNTYEARLQHLQTRVNDYEAYAEAMGEFIEENGTGIDVIESVQAELSTVTARLDSMEDHLAQVTERVESDLDGVGETVATLDDEVADLRDEVAALEADLDAEQAWRDAVADAARREGSAEL